MKWFNEKKTIIKQKPKKPESEIMICEGCGKKEKSKVEWFKYREIWEQCHPDGWDLFNIKHKDENFTLWLCESCLHKARIKKAKERAKAKKQAFRKYLGVKKKK